MATRSEVKARYDRHLQKGCLPEARFEWKWLESMGLPPTRTDVFTEADTYYESIPFYMSNRNLLKAHEAIEWIRDNLPVFHKEEIRKWSEEVNQAWQLRRSILDLAVRHEYNDCLARCKALKAINWMDEITEEKLALAELGVALRDIERRNTENESIASLLQCLEEVQRSNSGRFPEIDRGIESTRSLIQHRDIDERCKKVHDLITNTDFVAARVIVEGSVPNPVEK